MAKVDSLEEGEFSLFTQEKQVIRESEIMIRTLGTVSDSVRRLAEAYRRAYREQCRLLRISDRQQLELREANKALGAQADELRHLNEALRKEVGIREQMADELRRMAREDALTGLLSRRYLFELGEHEFRRRRRHGQPLGLLMMDLDYFKKINDGYGHGAGDQVLREFGALCRDCFREEDIVGRIGGEEFLAILPTTGTQEAARVAERIRARLAAQSIAIPGGAIGVTLSIGITEVLAADTTFDHAASRADAALYEAKNGGRNRIEILLPGIGSADTSGYRQ
ncbi:MAG TPA: GGDEF domain-containing protein [Rhodocyclaceae bacterium]|nr:GGDEF domain-containing protein [Rhodocyclaceae bacterium]